jgi:hypothetical protein
VIFIKAWGKHRVFDWLKNNHGNEVKQRMCQGDDLLGKRKTESGNLK